MNRLKLKQYVHEAEGTRKFVYLTIKETYQLIRKLDRLSMLEKKIIKLKVLLAERKGEAMMWDKDNIAFCGGHEIGFVDMNLNTEKWEGVIYVQDTGDPIVKGLDTIKQAKTAVEQAFHSFIRDVTKQGGGK